MTKGTTLLLLEKIFQSVKVVPFFVCKWCIIYIVIKQHNFYGIKITPVELLGDQTHAGLLNASEDTPSGVI